MTTGPLPLPPDFGINLIGHIRGTIGLSVAARGLALALLKKGIPLTIVNVDTAYGGTCPIPELEAHVLTRRDEFRHPVSLYVLPTGFHWIFESAPWLLRPGCLHVGCLWWEVTTIPPAWVPFHSQLDAIMANSDFIAGVTGNCIPLTPTVRGMQPISLPPLVAPDRHRFGLPENATVFVTSFDPNSDPARKHPLAPLIAFRNAFDRSVSDACLAIRVNHADASNMSNATVQALVDAAGGDPRIRLLREPMSYADVLSLYASGDAYVSLHRSEGLGLGLMEAMALGKPVIATGWSGNMSFMDHACGCPVRYRLIRAEGNHEFYGADFLGPNAQWADPVIEDAVAWMRRLHAEPDLRAGLGQAARKRIEAYQSEAWEVRWVQELVALWQAQKFLPRVQGKLSTLPTGSPAAIPAAEIEA